MGKKSKKKKSPPQFTHGNAPKHGELVNNNVHVFVDDQNLFYGITNGEWGSDYRIDFGSLSIFSSRDHNNNPRGIETAFLAGVIPDDDSFWQAAKDQGWDVKRGFLGSGGKSKQDDAFIIAEIVETLWSKDGPSTIVLVAGDADYGPALTKAIERGWRVEVAFIKEGRSSALDDFVHQFRTINPLDIQRNPSWR